MVLSRRLHLHCQVKQYRHRLYVTATIACSSLRHCGSIQQSKTQGYCQVEVRLHPSQRLLRYRRVKSLELIYDTTPESDKGLHNIAVETATDQIKDLCARKDFKVLCTSRGDVAFDIMRATAEKRRSWGSGYGPTSPLYSPASPVFAPTSPVYRPFGM
jgi:hypothetical protein